MRRGASFWVIGSCLGALLLACFGRAIFQGEQFGYRDAGHYYYPLYQRVQQEWDAGRWPLWEPEENAGMPLLGNPTAAVLYPGKLIYAALPYPAAARAYVIAHVLLAFFAMFALVRSWGATTAGSCVSALGYAFGAPILFQYCNIIYLVGAAWAPLGWLAVDRWLRLGRRGSLLWLAVVLAMETLGGDPEIAYLTGACAGGYALILARARARSRGDISPSRLRGFLIGLGVILGLAAWVVGTLAMARAAPGLRPYRQAGQPTAALSWMPYVGPSVLAVWGLIGVALIRRWLKARGRGDGGDSASTLVPALAGLAGSALLAALISAAQLLPVLEFTGQSVRAATEGPHEIYTFSLEPHRVVELLWPNLFGTPFHGNRSWLPAVTLTDKPAKIWVPSLYMGAASLVLALGAMSWRATAESPWRVWLSAVALLSLLASFGEYTSPLYWARFSPEIAAEIGPHDDDKVAAIRFDKYLRDGDGGLYWALAHALPGFRQFRFPSKLLTLTILALSALAGLGWDQILAGDRGARRRASAWGILLLLATIGAYAYSLRTEAEWLAWLKSARGNAAFGPMDAEGAIRECRWAFLQAGAILVLVLAVAWRGRKRPVLASGLMLVALAADLAVANARYVLTVPQSLLETEPEVLKVIRDAERDQRSDGPFRVHRMPIWDPVAWREDDSEDRVRDFVAWERDTLQPKYGVPLGIHYAMTLGVAELFDYEWFFGGFLRKVDEQGAQTLGIAPRSEVVVFPRRAFDLWTTRYFIVPYYPNGWDDENRGFASFLKDTEVIYPPPESLAGEDAERKQKAWARDHDVQVRRSRTAYPRAWVVHEARFVKPVAELNREERNAQIQEMLFENDFLWHDESRRVWDPRRVAWVDTDDRALLGSALSGANPGPSEAVTVTAKSPVRVELEASLDTPGLVILADVYYPGWKLAIDGQPAPVLRANWMMRAAAVPSGKHKLVYTYEPGSFRLGLWISSVGLACLAGLLLGNFIQGRRHRQPSADHA